MAERALVAAAVIAIGATDALYITLIRGQGAADTADVLTIPFVAAFQLLMALLLVASLIVPAAARPATRAAPSAGLVVLGWLAAMSIGIPLLFAAGLSIAATVLALNAGAGFWRLTSTGLAAVASLALLIGGFEFSWHHLVCPPTGQMGGTTATLLPGQSVTYDCNAGVLSTH